MNIRAAVSLLAISAVLSVGCAEQAPEDLPASVAAQVLDVAVAQDEAFLNNNTELAFSFYEPSCQAQVDLGAFVTYYAGVVERARSAVGAGPNDVFAANNSQITASGGNEAWVTSDVLLNGALILAEQPEDADRYVFHSDRWWATCDRLGPLIN